MFRITQTPKHQTPKLQWVSDLGETLSNYGAKAHLLPVSVCASSRRLTHDRRARLGLVGVRYPAVSVHAEPGISQTYADQTDSQAAICVPLPLEKLASDDTRVAHRRLVDSKCEVPDVIRNDELPVNIRWLGAVRQHSLQSLRTGKGTERISRNGQ